MSDEIIKIDLHGMIFRDAKTELLDSLEGYCKSGYGKFEIIHGYRKGQVLRKYVREKLKGDFELKNPSYSLSQNISGKGVTTVIISTK